MEDKNYFLPTSFQINERVGKLSTVALHISICLLTSYKKTQTFIATSICIALKKWEKDFQTTETWVHSCLPTHPRSFWLDFVWFCPGRTQWREQIMNVVLITVWRETLSITIQYLLIGWSPHGRVGGIRWEGHSGNLQMEAVVTINNNEIVPWSHKAKSSKALCHGLSSAPTPQGWETPSCLRETFSFPSYSRIELHVINLAESSWRWTSHLTLICNCFGKWPSEDNGPARFDEVTAAGG